MLGYAVRRLLWMPPLLWAVATVTFVLMHAIPGGPFSGQAKAGPPVVEALERAHNLDEPLWEQYVLYLWNLLHLDLGVSYTRAQDVGTIISEGMAVSAQLGVISFAVAVTVGMGLGLLSALNQNGPLDYLGVFFATVGAAMPSFILATFLVVVFSVNLGWTDVLGWEFGNPRKMVLPVAALSVLPTAYIARMTRASVLDVLRQDYIRTARAKGLPEYAVVLRHAMKNAMIPVLTILGPLFAVLITGSFIVEGIFEINGIGRRFVDAVFNRDYGLIMGTTIFYAVIVAFANLIVDLLYGVVDPRIRYQG
ncbi:MAG: ABC transporter permease subunit [Dehalococcoidia bacterium]|nr:ABC transporter permease subunit [Dehalococcoidia bacterium]